MKKPMLYAVASLLLLVLVTGCARVPAGTTYYVPQNGTMAEAGVLTEDDAKEAQVVSSDQPGYVAVLLFSKTESSNPEDAPKVYVKETPEADKKFGVAAGLTSAGETLGKVPWVYLMGLAVIWGLMYLVWRYIIKIGVPATTNFEIESAPTKDGPQLSFSGSIGYRPPPDADGLAKLEALGNGNRDKGLKIAIEALTDKVEGHLMEVVLDSPLESAARALYKAANNITENAIGWDRDTYPLRLTGTVTIQRLTYSAAAQSIINAAVDGRASAEKTAAMFVALFKAGADNDVLQKFIDKIPASQFMMIAAAINILGEGIRINLSGTAPSIQTGGKDE